MKKIITICTLACFILFSCNTTNDIKRNIRYKQSNINGFSLGLYDETSSDRHQVIYKLKSDESFTPTIKINNNFNRGFTYRLLILQNYEQKEIKLNNKMMDYIDVNIGRNQSKEFRIEVNVEKGVNDLLILCIRDPDNILDKEQYVPTGTVYLARRAVTIKGVEYKQKNIPPKK